MRIKKIKYINSKGLSIVEVMVALAITSIIITAVVTLYSASLGNFFQIKETGKQANESIVLFTMLEKDFSRGGFNHPFRGNPEAGMCGVSAIYKPDALKIINSSEVSSCFDKIFFSNDGSYTIERFKVTYKLDGTILYKKMERADDCNTIITALCSGGDTPCVSENGEAFIHDWQPVSGDIQSFEVVQVTSDKVDVEITFQSPIDANLIQNMKKRIFLKNKLLALNARICGKHCPNSVKPFANYEISSDIDVWNPELGGVEISGARVFFDSGTFDEDEETLIFPGYSPDEDPDEEAVVGVSGDFSSEILTITGEGSPSSYQEFIRRIQYAVLDDDNDETEGPSPITNPIKNIHLLFGTDVCDVKVVQIETTRHAYCYIRDTEVRWDQAKQEAGQINLFGNTGFLATIDDNLSLEQFRNLLSDESAIGWIGGKKKIGIDYLGIHDVDPVWTWTEPGNHVCRRDLLEIAFCISNASVEIMSHTYADSLGVDSCSDLVGGEEDFCLEADSFNTYMNQQYYLYFSHNEPLNKLKATYLNGDNGSGINGYILEFVDAAGRCNEENLMGCLNYYMTKEIITNDLTYTNSDMVNLCWIEPS